MNGACLPSASADRPPARVCEERGRREVLRCKAKVLEARLAWLAAELDTSHCWTWIRSHPRTDFTPKSTGLQRLHAEWHRRQDRHPVLHPPPERPSAPSEPRGRTGPPGRHGGSASPTGGVEEQLAVHRGSRGRSLLSAGRPQGARTGLAWTRGGGVRGAALVPRGRFGGYFLGGKKEYELFHWLKCVLKKEDRPVHPLVQY